MRKWFAFLKEAGKEQLRLALRATHPQGERDVQGSEQHIPLLQLQLGIVTVAVGSFKSLLHKIQELFAAAEIPRVTRAESEIPALPFLCLVLSQTCISHIPFPARKGFACTENCTTFM